jgi:hypothetical protein
MTCTVKVINEALVGPKDCITLDANKGWKGQSIHKASQNIARPRISHEIWSLKKRLKLTAPTKYHLREAALSKVVERNKPEMMERPKRVQLPIPRDKVFPRIGLADIKVFPT